MLPKEIYQEVFYRGRRKMGINICQLQEKRLVDRLRSPKVKEGEVIEKRRMESFSGRPERKIVVVKFKNRIIETNFDDVEFERTEIGERIWFSPPVPDRDPCTYHLFVWLIVGITSGALATWAITTHFHGKIAAILSLAAAGWISVIAWARICSHEQSKCLRDLKTEVAFFEAGGDDKQGEQK